MRTQTKYTLIVLAMCVLMMGAGQQNGFCILFPPPGEDACGNTIDVAAKGWVCANPFAPVNQNTTCQLPLGAANGGNALPCLRVNQCIGPAASFLVTVPPAVQSGAPFTFTVQALNNGNGTSTNYTGTVHFTAPGSNPGTFTLPANAALTNGKGTFTATLNEGQLANQDIAVTDTADATITGTSPLIHVQLPRLVVTAPGTVASGTPFSFMVTALDVNNAVLTTYSGTLHFDGSVGAAVLPADSTLTNGTGTFSATLPELGVPKQFIGATDTANPLITAASGAIQVIAGSSDPATHFQVTAPSTVISGSPFNFSVQALNDSNGPTSNYTGKVHFTDSASTSSVLPADTKLSKGSGTFSATLTAGVVFNHTIGATDTVIHSITGESGLIVPQIPGVPAFRSPSPRADEPHLLTAAASCPSIGFFQPTSLQTIDTDINNQNLLASILYRQPDGSFTAQGFSLPGIGSPGPQLLSTAVGTSLGNIPQAQRFFANCRGLAPWTPAPHPTVLADTPGTMSLPLVVANLGGKPYAEILANPLSNAIRVSLDTQGTLGQSTTVYPVGVAPIAILTGDFNGDGLRDVAVLNFGFPGPGSVSILLGTGGGLLAPAKSFSVGNEPVAMTSFDFNKDGHTDLAVVNQLDNTVTVLIANPDGSMKPGVTLALPGATSIVNSIVAADFDGDTNADILVYSSLGFSLLHGNGDGTFVVQAQKTGQSVEFGSQFLATGDFNKDGKIDVASYNSDGTVTILLNAGDGSFPNTARFVAGSLGSAGAGAGGMFATDFNDDGNLDLVFGSGHPDAIFANPAFVTVLLGNGDGTLQAPPAKRVGFNTRVLARADFNGDNRNDVVVASLTSAKTPGLWILLGAQGGGFQTPTQLAVPSSGTFIPWVTTGDVNNDGKADIIAIDDKGTLFTFLGNGNGTFQTASSVNVAPSGSFVVAGDLNGDGRSDAVIANGNINAITPGVSPTVAVAIAGGATFNSVGFAQTGPNTLQVALADVNGDKNLDLIAVNHGVGQTGIAGAQPSAGNVSVSFGNGDGTFQAPVSYPVGLNPTSIAVADVNGDNKPDLIVGAVTATSAVIGVLINAGNGAFGSPALLPTYSWPANIVAADFDGDGKQDLAIIHIANDAPISILRGHGDGTFDPETLLLAGSQPQAAIAADFTGDGKLDLAVSNFTTPGSGTVNLFANISGIQPSATHFAVSGPASAISGASSLFTATALDASNNIVTGYTGTVHLSSSDGAASLPGNITFTAASQGTFAFTATLKSLGGQTITATDTADSSVNGTSGVIAVAAATGPAWTVGITHISTSFSNFSTGQPLAFFTITVSNTQSLFSTSQGVAVSVVSPVAVTLSGANWNCGTTSCTRSDSLPGGASYPPITVAVNLTSFTGAQIAEQVTVSGGGLAQSSASDSATLAAAFTDVLSTDLFLPAIDLLRESGITKGCSPTTYCGGDSTTQAQMAVFIVRSVLGTDNFTFNPTSYFTDVLPGNVFFPFIQKMQELGIALSCGPDLFCPDSPVTRGQMAVLIIRARYGLAAAPNFPTTPAFTDVPSTSFFFPFIQKMKQVGITTGCSPTTYCPNDPVTRGQMAVFIMRGMFNLVPSPPAVNPLLSVAPATILPGQTMTVTIQGQNTNFVSGSTQVTAGPGITVTNVNVVNATTLTAQFAIAANAGPGPRSIVATTGAQEATLPNGFLVSGPI